MTEIDVGAMELIPSTGQLVFTDKQSFSLYLIDTASRYSVPTKVQLAAAGNVTPSAVAVNPYTR